MSIFNLIPSARTLDRELDRQIGSDAIKAQPAPPCEAHGGCPYAALCAGYKLACESFNGYVNEPITAGYREWRTMPRDPSRDWFKLVWAQPAAAKPLQASGAAA